MDLNSYLMLCMFIALCMAAAAGGVVFRPGEWYRDLAKPSWTPPNWVFGPVWTVLYAMIAVAGWLLWKSAGFAGAPVAFTLYGIQLVFNAAWSFLFFDRRRVDLALIDVGILWCLIAATITAFYQVDLWAALLLVPYLMWVTAAALLNFHIWRFNSDRVAA